MTRTPYTLDDVGGALHYRALRSFVGHLGRDSALWRELNDPDGRMTAWLDGTTVPWVLADLFDAVRHLEGVVTAASGGRPRRARPYPRPDGREHRTQRVGRDPVRVRDFDAWWDAHVGREA